MPRIRLGALVIFISNHPSTEPMIKVMRTFSGMNHLHNSTTVGFKKLAGKKKKKRMPHWKQLAPKTSGQRNSQLKQAS